MRTIDLDQYTVANMIEIAIFMNSKSIDSDKDKYRIVQKTYKLAKLYNSQEYSKYWYINEFCRWEEELIRNIEPTKEEIHAWETNDMPF